MRTKTAQAEAVIANPSHSARIVVWVADGAGDLQEIGGGLVEVGMGNGVLELSVEEDVDNPRKCTFKLQLTHGLWSRAPLNIGSTNPQQPSEASITVGREVLVECIVTPPDHDIELSAGCRLTIFNGFVDEVTFPEDDLEVVCTDRMAQLRDRWIEAERVYGFCTGAYATKGAFVWRYDLPALAVGDLVIPSKLNMNGHFYEVTAAASAQSASEPTWPTGGGSTVVSGGVTFTERGSTSTTGIAVETLIQQILTDNGISETLITPVSPGWTIFPYVQERTSVMDAVKVLSNQIGWRLCFSWYAASSSYRLQLFAPDRTRVTVDKALTLDGETSCNELKLDIFSIRNVVRVVYGDAGSRDPDGLPSRLTREASDSASITKYGRRFMELREGDVSNIDSAGEADVLAAAVLADLKEPTVALGIDTPIDPFVELGDMVQAPADGRRFNSALLLAVEKLRHTFSAKAARSAFTTRGQPVAARTGWLAMDGMRKVNKGDVHTLTVLDSTAPNHTMASVIGGQSIEISGDNSTGGKTHGTTQHEIHISATPGFTPSSSTKKAGGSGRTFGVADLVPGKTYYRKTVPFVWNASQKVRGSPSVEASFVAGRAKAGHYDSASTQSHLPLNGNFEHMTDPSGPPDHWAPLTNGADPAESWGSSGTVWWGNDSAKGNYLKLSKGSVNGRGRAVSSLFEIRRGIREANVYFSIRRQTASAASGQDLQVVIRGFADAAGATAVFTYTVQLSADSAGAYPTLNTWYEVKSNLAGFGTPPIPTNCNFIRIDLQREAAGSGTVVWEVGDVYFQEADFFNMEGDYLLLHSDLAVDGAAVIQALSVPSHSHVRAKTASAGSYANGDTLAYGTEDYDTLSEYATGTGIFTATKAGKYLVSAALFGASQSYDAGQSVQCGLKKNGTAFAYGYRAFAPSTASWYLTSAVTTVVDLAVGDTLEAYISHDRAPGGVGANVTLYTDASGNYLTIDRIL